MDPLKKELWRLRINWVVTCLMIPIFSTSQIGISSSFHQFVTNPTLEQIKNGTYKELEPGIGSSEAFYSLLIAGFEFGGMVGGFLSGVLIGFVPYWYLWLISLVTHILGYIIYSVTYNEALIMLSRILAGYILGAIVTLCFAYFASTSATYVEIKRKLGMKTNEKSVERTRNNLFVAFAFGYSSGFVIGPGVAVIFAQFEYINQFRAIGWFNVAYGVVALGVLTLLFRGEMKCGKVEKENCSKLCQKKKSKDSTKSKGIRVGALPTFIIVTLIILSFTERIRFAVVQTLVNPIASDSFGINERDASYIFLALALPQFGGAIALLIFQCFHVSNQAITLFGIMTTVSGYLLLTDFQAIPYDPCTEYSPFHHPYLTDHYNISHFHGTLVATEPPATQSTSVPLPILDRIQVSSNIRLQVADDISYDADLGVVSKFHCKQVQTCSCDLITPCLYFPMETNSGSVNSSQNYQCKSDVSHITLCVTQLPQNQHTDADDTLYAQIESINVLPKEEYIVARSSCIEANVTGHQCHWTPSSTVTKKECEDCQPICRSVHQTLTFPQFVLGLALLLFSSALQLPPIVALLTNQSPKRIQGFVIGCMSATNSIMRTISPLIMDALYEKVQKRTFVFTLLMVVVHIPFIIEIIVLYPKLGPRTDLKEETEPSGYSKLEQDESSDDEESQLPAD